MLHPCLYCVIIYYRRGAAIAQFVSGLAQNGLLDRMKDSPLTYRGLFVHVDTTLNRQTFKELCTYVTTPGSNHHQGEEETIMSWELLLQDIEGELVGK